MIISIAIVCLLTFLLFNTTVAAMRVLGVDFIGDNKRMTCPDCEAENIEHEARQNPYSSAWLFWEATSEHKAKCGLVCANGMNKKDWDREFAKPAADRQFHSSGLCPRCKDES